METGLTLPGWFFLFFAWGSIISVTIFCFWRILVSQKERE